MREDYITFINEKGLKTKCNVLFDLETSDKNYLIYTDNSLLEDGSKKVYASSYIIEEDEKILSNIDNDKEWKMIEAILSYLTKES